MLLSLAGLGILLRKMIGAIGQTVELIKNDDEYTFNTVSTLKSFVIKFKLGEEFEEETPDGLKVMSVITLDDNKLIHIRKSDKPQTIIREFTDNALTITMIVNNVTCKRFYTAVV